MELSNNNTSLGLSTTEVEQRRKKFGENIIFHVEHFGPFVQFIKKFSSPLQLMLLGAAIVAFVVGQKTNAIIIVVMVSISAVMDFVNTRKSSRAEASLLARVITMARVYRDGRLVEVAMREVVPGDVVQLVPGSIVPADGVLITADDFFINQSTLTGESFPIEKSPGASVESEATSIDRKDMVFMGTTVVSGLATATITATGKNTQFGAIAERLRGAPAVTEFERGIRSFSSFIMKVTTVLVLVVFVTNTLTGKDLLTSFTFALAIAIGLTPELLPVILTVSLSRGAVAMSKRDVIVKRLPAIQNLGSMNVLCTDKTGTLTEDNIKVIRAIGPFGGDSRETFTFAYISSFYHTGVQNPLDSAITQYRTIDIHAYQKIDEIPFDFIRRRQSVVVQNGSQRILITKGAPEDVFGVCTTVSTIDGQITTAIRDRFREQLVALSAEGYRVLGVATRTLPVTNDISYEPIVERDLCFHGFILFYDPPKDTARQAVADLFSRGVEVKILTGDNEILAEKVCRDIGLAVKNVLTGQQVGQLDDGALGQALNTTTIFARVSPVQKERIIRVLRANGRVVGYLGDGINDAPALKAADVGITVNNAVDVAKESSSIILLRKSLRVLNDGILEGRRTFQNTLKYMMMGLSSNFGNMFSMMVASVLLPFLPMLPSQILLNNFLYDSAQFGLASDRVDDASILQPPHWKIAFIRRYMVVFGLASSIFDFITFGVLAGLFKLTDSAFQTGWFIESLTTQVLVIFVIRSRKLSFIQSMPSRMLILNTLFIVAIAWLLPVLPIASSFHFVGLPLTILLSIGGIVLAYLGLVEIVKRWFFRRYVHT